MIAVPYINLPDEIAPKVKPLLIQKFKPEMIVEMFEGYKYKSYKLHGDDYDCYTNDNWFFIFSEDSDGEFFQKGYWDGLYPIRFQDSENCKTLDHFISDCQRAGIELTWKGSIVDKYFK